MTTTDLDGRPPTERRQSARDRERMRGPAAGGGWARTAGGTPSILVLTREPGLGLALARAAEAQHLSVALCWSAADVQRAPFWAFDAAIADPETWAELQRNAGPRLAAALGRVPLVLVDGDAHGDDYERFDARLIVRIGRRQGAAAAVEAALRTLHYEAQPHVALPGLHHEHGRRRADEVRKLRIAIIEAHQPLADALASAARRHGLLPDLYADVAHYLENAERRPAHAVIVGVAEGALHGLDLDAALAKALGPVPGVLLGAASEPAAAAGQPRAFVHLKRTAPLDEIVDAVAALAERPAPLPS